MDHNVLLFRGSITRPVSSLHPASYPPLLMMHAGSFLSCWLGFAQVGLGANLTHWVTLTSFFACAFPSSRACLARHQRELVDSSDPLYHRITFALEIPNCT